MRSFWSNFENEPRDMIFYIHTNMILPSILVKVLLKFFWPLRSYEVTEGQKRSFWFKFENEHRDIIFTYIVAEGRTERAQKWKVVPNGRYIFFYDFYRQNH